jgi:surface protein
MDNMFNGASAFNQPIGNWNTANVTNMHQMFSNASNFNSGCATGVTSSACSLGWNTGEVTTMENMFKNASNFNQDIGSWKTVKVTNLAAMFDMASRFNQDLSAWCFASTPNSNLYDRGATSWNLPKPNFSVSC